MHACSFIVTSLDVSTPTTAAQVEHWYRHRTDIEDRIRDAKHGAALRHLPSSHYNVNLAWTWAGLLAVNLGALLQHLTGLTDTHGHAHLGTLRHRVLQRPGRVLSHGHTLTLRLATDDQLLPDVLSKIRQLPAA